jgi:hypothetical protein
VAKAKNPLFSLEAHGALGGIEFRTGNYGNVVSRRSISAHGQSQAQYSHRAHIKHAHSSWMSQPPSIKDAWNAYATPPLTGRMAYIGAAIRNFAIGLAAPMYSPLDPDIFATPYNFALFGAPPPPPGGRLVWIANLLDTNKILIYLRNTPGPTMPNKRKFTFIASVSASTMLYDLPYPAPTPFGAIRIVYWDPIHGHEFWTIGGRFTWGEYYEFPGHT